MKLYGNLTSPFVRKLRVLVHEKALPVEFVVIDNQAPDGPLADLNPLIKIPVLQRANGDTLFDSPVIAEYLDALTAPGLVPADGELRWQALRWQALADGMLDATVTRLLELRRPVEQQSAAAVASQERKLKESLAWIERHYPGGTYLLPERFTLADLCVGVALEYIDFRYPHDWRTPHPRLAAWLAGIAARPSFRATAPPRMDAPVPR
jgi:glutathione S-transferase